MTVERLVVVGASLAGLRAVEAARKTGFTGSITLIGAEPHLPYDRPPLSKAYLDSGDAQQIPAFRTEGTLRTELGVELLLGTVATALDTTAKVLCVQAVGGAPVAVHSSGGAARSAGDVGGGVPYDALVIATGARARTLPGTDGLDGVHVLRTIDDAIAVRAALDAGARTVVIGAGFIGSEVASGARKRGLDVIVIEALPTPLVRATGQHMGERLAALHVRNGTDLRCGVGVERIEGDGRVERVVLADGTILPADLVVVGAGAAPETQWLQGSGLTLDNGIVCDENLWTGIDSIYVAGDVANWHNPRFGRRMRLEHWTSAAEQGAQAARNALNPAAAKPYSTVPYFWSDWYDARIQFVGTPLCDETVLVTDDLDGDNRLTALYRSGDELAGVLTVNGQSEIMKYRGLIARRASWSEALEFAATRAAARAAKLP